MAKSNIETMGNWSAKAAIACALEETDEQDGVIIIIHMRSAGLYRHYAANLTNAEANYMLDDRKRQLFPEE